MGLLPLEFTDGLTDSPYFRETLQAHERELDRTNVAIKHLIKDIKDLIFCAKNLSRAQRVLSETLKNFNFECIGTSQTDDEMVIANSFKDFARLLSTIEDERDRLLEKAEEAFLEPIERFRRDQIGSAKEAKKKFDKETTKHCQNLEKYLNTSTKKGGTQLQEADANYSIEQWHFFNAMSEYVLKLQEVNERKKFEFVETVLSFMLGWLTFYHQGHEIATDFYSVKMELQMRLQRTRNNFNMTQEETKCLRQKMLNNSDKFRQKLEDHGSLNKMYTRQGYLFLMEKKAFSTSWTKHFCQYEKSSRRLTMIQYTQTTGKIASTEEIIVKECIRRPTDLIDRRFCFDIVPDNSGGFKENNGNVNDSAGNSQNGGNGLPSFSGGASYSANTSSSGQSSYSNGSEYVYTFQALSEEDYKLWFEALEGKERKGGVSGPSTSGSNSGGSKKTSFKFGGGGGSSSSGSNADHHHHHHLNLPLIGSPDNGETFELDEEGYFFLRKCIQAIEDRGVEQKGIYRVVGVASKVRNLMEAFGEKRQLAKRRGSNSAGGESGGSSSAVPMGGGSSASASGESEEELPPLFELNLDSEDTFELKTLTSALKNYLRNLAEPIMTFSLHEAFISAAKLENRAMRIDRIHSLVHMLPPLNFKVLKTLIEHLTRVANQSEKNLMTPSNLGVCFGPTLLRTAEESVAAILDIKFVNVIAELLIENYETIFLSPPPSTSNTETDHAFGQQQPSTSTSVSGGSPTGAVTIQQRPLPTVPNNNNSHPIQMVSSYQNSANSPTIQQQLHSPTSPQVASSVFFTNAAIGSPTSAQPSNIPPQQYRYSVHPSATSRNAAYFSTGNHQAKQLSPTADIYGRLALMPNAAVPRRSSSQDQLHSSMIMGGGSHHHTNSAVAIQQARARASALYGGVSPTASAVQMMQMTQQQQLQRPNNLSQLNASGYATFPHQHQPQSAAMLGRKQQHLNAMLQSSSPLQATTSNNHGQNVQIYQSPSSAIYGHLMQQQRRAVATGGLPPMAVIQPSMSYQNLHYESSIAVNAAPAGDLAVANFGQNASHQLYHQQQRPMTSIGFSMPNSRVDGSGGSGVADGNSGIYQQLQHPQQLVQQQQQSTSPPSQTAVSSLLPSSRQFPLSSTSSASLPSTPEHSSANFHYGVLPSTVVTTARTPTAVQSLQQQQSMKQHSMTPPPLGNTYEQIAISGTANIVSPHHHQQQQAIYGTIGQRNVGVPTSPVTATIVVQQDVANVQQSVDKQSPLPSSKVRTRYVCIGGNDSELSFQPNMIITNVRPSREPGWIEGYLNGRTGLVPLNYVEFIE